MERVVFGEFAGEEAIGQARLFRGPLVGEHVGDALAPIVAGVIAGGDEPGVDRRLEQGVEPPQGHADSLGHRALGGARRQVDLTQEPEARVFLVCHGRCLGGGHGRDSSFVHA